MQNNNSLERMKSDKRKLKLKQLEKRYSKSSRMRRKGEELRRNMWRISEMNCIYKNQKSKLELRREKIKKKEKG